MFKFVRAIGYELSIRADDLAIIATCVIALMQDCGTPESASAVCSLHANAKPLTYSPTHTSTEWRLRLHTHSMAKVTPVRPLLI